MPWVSSGKLSDVDSLPLSGPCNHSPGADDIFVFMNTWKHVRRTQGHLHPVQQLQEALKTGGKAMVRALAARLCARIGRCEAHISVFEFGG